MAEIAVSAVPPLSPAQLLRSESGRFIRIGWIVVGAFFGILLVGSVVAPLSSAVVAQGLVKVDSSRKKIQHPEGGVVQEVLVRDGDAVARGDVLVRLDRARAGAAHSIARSGYLAALAQRARLQAERDGLPAVSYPEELGTQRAERDAAQITAAQDALFVARRSSMAGEITIIDRQIDALNKEIEGLTAQMEAEEAQIRSQRAEFEALSALSGTGVVEVVRIRAVERELARLEGERAHREASIAATRAKIGEKELEKFQVHKQFQQKVVDELRDVQSEAFDLAEREGASRHELEQTELRAPVDGTVVNVKVHTTGGVVGRGELLMEVVPSSDLLVVEAHVRPEDVDRVRIGLPTGVKFQAFNPRNVPELDGVLSYLSADAIQDERTGSSYFLVRVEVPDPQVARLGEGKRVQPGMLAEVFIRTGQRTFLGYLSQPLVDSFQRAWRER